METHFERLINLKASAIRGSRTSQTMSDNRVCPELTSHKERLSGLRRQARSRRNCVLIPTLRLKERLFVAFRTDRSNPCASTSIIGNGHGLGRAKMERSLVTDMPRDKYVERCKQRALDYLDRGDLRNAVDSFVSNMNARPDCELPQYLATLGLLLLMRNDALGWRTLIEGLR
jgi:hypothetical protein